MNRNIKRNKMQRAWHKYKKFIFLILIVFALVVAIVIGVIKAVGGKKDKKPGDNIIQSESSTPIETSEEIPTETQTMEPETTTEEPTTEPPTMATDIVKNPTQEEFIYETFYQDAVFVGDTFVAGIDLYKMLPSNKLISNVNWTISKATSNAVSQIASSNASKVFIEIGINDLNYEGSTGQKVYENYQKFIAAIKEKLPNAQICVISTFPVTTTFEAKSSISIKNTEVANLNELLSTMDGIKFLNVNKSISESDGSLMAVLSTNGLNIKKDYYGFILNLVAEMCQ